MINALHVLNVHVIECTVLSKHVLSVQCVHVYTSGNCTYTCIVCTCTSGIACTCIKCFMYIYLSCTCIEYMYM